MIIAVTCFVFLATSLGVLAVFWWTESRRGSLVNRAREVLAPSGEAAVPRPAGFFDRFPRLRRMASRDRRTEEIVSRVTAGGRTGLDLLLHQAGYRSPGAARFFHALRIGAPFLLPAAVVVAGQAIGLPNRVLLLMALLSAAAGLALPSAILGMKARRRRESIVDTLPDALDLLTVCVEAGLGINSAFVKIAEEFRISSPVLSEEFDVANREMVAGKTRTDALRSLAERTGVEDVKSLVAMLIQTEKLGTSLARSLRVHSDTLRTKRRQRAEEAAAKTTIKLVFPLVFLLFPALFIVILGPGVIQILRILIPAANGSAGG